MIAEDCREEFFLLQLTGKVLQCISYQEGMLTLKYGEKTFRVNPKLYKRVREPLYKPGDIVKITRKSLTAQIVDVYWHYKEGAPFYFVEVDGKKRSKRYWDSDFTTQ